MPKIRVEMDEGFHWFPLERDSAVLHLLPNKFVTLEVSDELLKEYAVAANAFNDIQDKLEQLYRVQEGLTPWSDPPIPEHVRITPEE